jgi:alanine-glyoxylate transaminase/serine-glyoxylate transaminase/serine-pyruvate transaminase
MQLPGPTNVPEAVLSALAEPTLDHRGDHFAAIFASVARDLAPVFGTTGPVAIYAGSGTGGWEAALVNTLSPGDRVLIAETGFFAAVWARLARSIGLDCQVIEGDWRGPADADAIGRALAVDCAHRIKAVLVVHNETSTGATSDIAAARAALDTAGHPALLLVDAVSSLGAITVEHDSWGVDVTVTASQKGLMLPPGLAVLAVSPKARESHRSAAFGRYYWEWDPLLAAAETGSTPYTPASNMIVALRAGLDLLAQEGLASVLARHERLAGAVRAAVEAWGLEFVCADPTARSNSITAVLLPDGVSDTKIRRQLLAEFGLTLGGGLGRFQDRCIRIGHLGDLDELMILSTLGALELTLPRFFAISRGGVDAALSALDSPSGSALGTI